MKYTAAVRSVTKVLCEDQLCTTVCDLRGSRVARFSGITFQYSVQLGLSLAGTFEVLYCPFMLFSGSTRIECTEVFALAGLWVFLLRVKSIFPRLQFSNHNGAPFRCSLYALLDQVVGTVTR
jgi:hypothetical protein